MKIKLSNLDTRAIRRVRMIGVNIGLYLDGGMCIEYDWIRHVVVRIESDGSEYKCDITLPDKVVSDIEKRVSELKIESDMEAYMRILNSIPVKDN